MQQNASLWIVVHGGLETLAMDIYVKDSVKRAPGRMKLCLRDLKDAVGAREFLLVNGDAEPFTVP